MSDALGAGFIPFAEDPYPFYAKVRQEEPITFCQDLNSWLVTRYEDIKNVLLQPENFSSYTALSEGMTFYPSAAEELMKGYPPVPIVINSNGVDHTRLRDPLIKAFSPAHAKAIEPSIREIANTLVNTFIDNKQADIMNQFACPLGLEVIHKLLGIPRQDINQTTKWIQDWFIMNTTQVDEERQVAYAQSTVALQNYLGVLIDERRTTPQDDIISELILFGTSDKEPLTDAELVYMLLGLILPGRTNPANLIGNGLRLLLECSERWQTLCDHLEQVPQAIEEILRFDCPIRSFGRITTREVTIGGVTLPKNVPILLVYGSGNRDETVFAHADEFQIERDSNHHFGFGLGIHYCVAAALARVEVRVAFEVLCQRLPHLRLVPEQTFSYVPVLNFRGYERLEVMWE